MRRSDDLIFTSVADALCSASLCSPKVIREAIRRERVGSKRSALVKGLEAELRRRKRPVVT